MLKETPYEQLTGVTRESIKQACLENGFKNKDSLYYHRRGSSVLKENVNYFVKTVECTDLQSALEKEFEAFDAKGYKNDNKCLMLFLFKEGLTEDEIDQKLTDYFKTNDTLTRSQFEVLCTQVKSTAHRILQKLVKDGKLKNVSTKQHPVYMPDNLYNKGMAEK
jgi:hypothetical protein